MARASMPERIAWAIGTLDVRPHDRLLEIGPGRGVSVAAVAERLDGGRIDAIDRSAKAVEAARERNAAAIASGRVGLHTVALEDAAFPDGSFDKVFAINVNLFWVRRAADELSRIRSMLTPGGSLYLFYEPPGEEKTAGLLRTVEAALRDGGFTTSSRTARRAGKPLLCVIGRR